MALVSELAPEEYARRCREGEPEAFGLLYDALAPEVQRVLWGMRLGLDAQQVEDLVQDAFLRLFRQLGRLDLERPLRPYLLGIARNLGIDAWRRRRVREQREAPLEGEPTGGADTAGAVGRAEESARVHDALAALDPERRSLLVLRHTVGLTMRELAEVLDCSVPTARRRLRDAARALGRELRLRGVFPEEHAA